MNKWISPRFKSVKQTDGSSNRKTPIAIPRDITTVSLLLFMTFTISPDAVRAEDEFILEEIIVTARKRLDVMQDVPISITTTTGAQIKNRNIIKLEELALSTPNLHVGEATVGNQVFIRGVGSGVNPGFEQTVGTYVDGIYYGRGQLSRAPFFDLERVEILKGPQGILFGKNTVAGALSLTTADPSEDFTASASALYEPNHNERNATGMISGSVAENLRARLALRQNQIDGWLDNPLKDQDEPGRTDRAGRLGLAWDAGENIELMLKLSHTEYRIDGRANQASACSPALITVLENNNYGEDCTDNSKKWNSGMFVSSLDGNSSYDFSQEDEVTRTNTASVALDWDINGYTLSSISGFLHFNTDAHTDGDFTQLSFVATSGDEEFKQLSQELRFASPIEETFEYLIGLYWQQAESDINSGVHVSLEDRVAPGVFAATRYNIFEQDATSWAVFTQGIWHLSEQWIATLGMRYSRERKDVQKNQYFAELGESVETKGPNEAFIAGFFGSQFNSFEHNYRGRRNEPNFSPNIVFQYLASDDTTLYSSVSRGFKGGGFDAVLGDGSEPNFEYEEEEVTAYELGSKMRLNNGAGVLNIALFRSDFKDVQVSIFDGSLGFLVTNAGAIRTQGIEIDGRYRVTESITVGANIGLLDASYTKFDGAQCYANQTSGCEIVDGKEVQDLSGEPTQFSPDYRASLNLEYQTSVYDRYLFTGFAEINISDDYAIANDLDPELDQDGFQKLNLRLALSPLKPEWEIALLGKNLTNEKTVNWTNDLTGFKGSYFVHNERPRSVALQLSMQL